LVRFEALARWTHPDLGSIPPDKFIPIAEESGMIVALGTNILERACEEAVHWQALAPYPIQVAVNVSPLQFARDNFVDEVTHILNRTGLSPSLLQLELTESVVLSGVARAADTMKSLRALGVGLAIDDFGKGYSCLSYLSDLPFEALKIDRSFLKDLTTRRQTRVTVVSLIGLAHNLGMRVIVEGVENQDQMDLLRELGANEAQGYLLGRPTADPASLISLLFQRLKGRTAFPKPFLDNSRGQPHPECVTATVVGSIGLLNQSVHLN
jgi:EAL domain-containing protein (putative c-di-GMP-specific phosphodiesterase class I)